MYGELPLIKTSTGTEIPGYPIEIQNPPKTAVVRLPTTDELLDYLRAQKSLYRDLGRRMGEGEDVPTPVADQKLFRAIRIDKDGVEWDEHEAAKAIGSITRHKVMSCERDGLEYIVTLRTPFGDTVHVVRIPYEKEMSEYRKHVYKPRDLPHGVEERRFPPEVPAKLYDLVIKNINGYHNSTGVDIELVVPPHHKRAVVTELVSTIAALDTNLDPNY